MSTDGLQPTVGSPPELTLPSRLQQRRYLSLWCPFLPADRWRLEPRAQLPNPAPAISPATEPARPLVFIEKVKGASRLAAVEVAALELGLEPGLTLADARARVPALKAVAHDPAADQAFLARLAETAYAFTPSVAFERPDGLVLDITGCAHLFGGEEGLLARLAAALQAEGVSAIKSAIAPTPEMARALARFGSPSRQDRCASGASPTPHRRDTLRPPRFLSEHVPRAPPPLIVDDTRAVRALPVAALEGAPEDIRALRRAGLKTIGDVASRPSVLFTTRFTPAFTLRLARILGEEDRRITPRHPPPVTMLEHRCAEPILTADAVLAILGDLVVRAVRLLEERGEGARRLEATFFRTDGAVRRLPIETSRPARDPSLVLRLVRDRLEALADPLDPGFGFDLVRLEVQRAEPWSPAQTSLDANDTVEDELAGLVDRLGAMFGAARIQRLAPVDTHLPERAQRVHAAADRGNRRDGRPGSAPVPSPSPHFGIPKAASHTTAWPTQTSTRPLHLFSPPQPIEMLSNRFRWRRIVHDVIRLEGPERISDEWWATSSGYGTRDYYRAETAQGRRFWIFRAHADARPASQSREPQGEGPDQARWFLHGVLA